MSMKGEKRYMTEERPNQQLIDILEAYLKTRALMTQGEAAVLLKAIDFLISPRLIVQEPTNPVK